MDPTDPAYAGQHSYTWWFLRIYDVLVLAIYGPLVWRCPTRRLVQHYTRHLGRRHLDVGPGTGYFLEHARLPAGASILLVDPNPDVLVYAAKTLAHNAPGVPDPKSWLERNLPHRQSQHDPGGMDTFMGAEVACQRTCPDLPPGDAAPADAACDTKGKWQ